jgi:hypothetical protein
MLFELLVGMSLQSKPENGTWWDSAYGQTRFQQTSYAAGAAVRGENWAVQAQTMGRETSDYTDQFNVRWQGQQTPVGVWAIWEPHAGPLYLQAGAGAVKPNFREKNSVGMNDGNTHVVPSYLLGAGWGVTPRFGVVGSVRYVYTPVHGAESPNNLPNLGKFAVALQTTWRM